MHYIEVNYGGGQTGSEPSSIGAYLPTPKPRPGWWPWLVYQLSQDECVAKIDRYGEWAKPGWEHVLPELRERYASLP